MHQLHIESLILSKYPGFPGRLLRPLKSFIFLLTGKILKVKDINSFLTHAKGKSGIDFIDEIFEYLDFSYILSAKDRDKIKSEGRVVIISNHPLGGLDGLALVKLISEIRPDVKIVVNDFLLNIEELKQFFLPYDLTTPKAQSRNVRAIIDYLNHDHAVIIFPAGVVSRFGLKGIRDGKWNKGFLFFAKATNSPILPLYIEGRNTVLFYLVGLFSSLLSMLMLPRELFKKKRSSIKITIGNSIPPASFSNSIKDDKTTLKLLRKHLFRIAKNKPGIFKTEKNIIHPVGKKELKKQILQADVLGETSDGKLIVLLDSERAPDVMREIGRLRELTFRKVGEGTGKRIDLDYFDKIYRQIVLWDDSELEIAGAYRIGECSRIYPDHKLYGIYSASLFTFSEELTGKLHASLELGRSFVNAKYWNSHALDYLWQGIGSYLAVNPEIKFLFGPVSISNAYPQAAKELLVFFFRKYFSPADSSVFAKNPFFISPAKEKELSELFSTGYYRADFLTLKNQLKILGFSVPVLLKQYTELCEPGGVTIYDFNIDPDFENCIDGLILVEVEKLKEQKRARYIKSSYTKAV